MNYRYYQEGLLGREPCSFECAHCDLQQRSKDAQLVPNLMLSSILDDERKQLKKEARALKYMDSPKPKKKRKLKTKTINVGPKGPTMERIDHQETLRGVRRASLFLVIAVSPHEILILLTGSVSGNRRAGLWCHVISQCCRGWSRIPFWNAPRSMVEWSHCNYIWSSRRICGVYGGREGARSKIFLHECYFHMDSRCCGTVWRLQMAKQYISNHYDESIVVLGHFCWRSLYPNSTCFLLLLSGLTGVVTIAFAYGMFWSSAW